MLGKSDFAGGIKLVRSRKENFLGYLNSNLWNTDIVLLLNHYVETHLTTAEREKNGIIGDTAHPQFEASRDGWSQDRLFQVSPILDRIMVRILNFHSILTADSISAL